MRRSPYSRIRDALSGSFSVETLHLVTRLSHELLESDTPVRHPAAIYLVGATAQKVASYWNGHGVRAETAAAIEAHLKPKLEAVLNAAEADDDGVLLEALDAMARAYVDTLPFLKSIGS